MLEAYASAIQILFDPINLLVLLGAVVIGLLVGAIPGLSGLIVIPLLLPFVFRMPAEIALILIVSLHAVIHTSGSIPAILLNIPGTPPNAATSLDGFPMSQRGEGARAIGASVASSMLGGMLPVLLALAMVPAVMPLILAFGQPEMAALVLVGIFFLGSLSGGSIAKGLASGMFGLLLSFVGYQSITGVHRFTFGTAFLYDGIELMALVLGLFGLSEFFSFAMAGRGTIAPREMTSKLSDVLQGVADVWRHRWLWLRSTIIGYVIGVIPGIGAEVATWVCYGQARQTSRNPDEFGTGVVEGVIAPEAANNAKEAGSLLTTMALGLPGSSIMAILLAALTIVGLTPGPRMMEEHLPLALTLLLGVAVANLVGGVICLLAGPYLGRVASVRLDLVFTGVLIVTLAGVYTSTLSILDFIVLLVFGLLGLAMKIHGYSRPALLLGFVLGVMFEKYSLLSVKIYGPYFLFRPIPLILIAVTAIVVGYPYLRRTAYRLKRGRRAAGRTRGGLAMAVLFLLLGLYGLVQSLLFGQWEAVTMPAAMSGVVAVMAAVEVVRWARHRHTHETTHDTAAGRRLRLPDDMRRLALVAGWTCALMAGIYLVGFLISVPLFAFSYLTARRRHWAIATVFALAMLGFVYGTFEVGLKAPLYEGLLFGGR